MIWIGAIFLMILEKEDEISHHILQTSLALSERSGFKWFIHPVTNFWLSGAGGGFERSQF